jgi:hypothetical protein
MRGLRTATALVAALALSAFAGTARADNASDARAVADRFMAALIANDGATACSLLSPRALAVFGGPECPSRFTDTGPSEDDYDALETLSEAYKAARKSSARRHGDFVRKGFSVKQLARDMERIDTDLTVKVGKGPLAAKGQLSTTAVLDRRTSARRVVIYVEGDSGAIYRVTGTAFDDPTFRKVADGIPEAPKPPPAPPTYTIDSVAAASDGRAYVSITVTDPSSRPPTVPFYLLLVPTERGYLVDDILLPLIATAETIGEGG